MVSQPREAGGESETTLGREFLLGLSRPSLQALAISLAVPVVTFALFAALITPNLIAPEAHGYFARDAGDSDLFITARVAALERADPDRPVVAILGGSAILESFISPEAIERSVARLEGIDVEVWSLASWGQSLNASLAIAERFPQRFDGVVVIGITPFGLALGPAVRPHNGVNRLDFEDDLESSQELALSSESGNFFWENKAFFLPRLRYLACGRVLTDR